MRCGKIDMRCGRSDTRCGRSDKRCGKSDKRCGRSDTRCGRIDMRGSGSDMICVGMDTPVDRRALTETCHQLWYMLLMQSLPTSLQGAGLTIGEYGSIRVWFL